jgi:hypothetical protein
MKKTCLLICIIFILQLCGCKNEKSEYSESSPSSQKAIVTTVPPTTSIPETTTTPITTEKEVVTVPFKTVDTQVPLEKLKGSKISEKQAADLCEDKLIKDKEANRKSMYPNMFYTESAAKFDDNYYYLVRGYNSMEDHMATFGWYFVNADTGEVYDAGPSIGELIVIPNE